jgi:hypothetical protein
MLQKRSASLVQLRQVFFWGEGGPTSEVVSSKVQGQREVAEPVCYQVQILGRNIFQPLGQGAEQLQALRSRQDADGMMLNIETGGHSELLEVSRSRAVGSLGNQS